ncbi:differentially expressed in FDCP 6 homolog isoform X2 [Denticeps clupeoides]|uniref:differentially expressed in FDCP 6 homolog isoform X2 n=1 Tax=Denticeps clupeoides TaxID=299321 RepID=UPI0010A3B957|nr:differentially expressed in FDCP 6 homolog isoform X2 [Denticeps clupeoides]
MDFKSELLKSIWYAFTSLDAEHSGKVSKSQLKVLSHNLYTVLNIPHDPVALEEHFQDNDNGPVSSHGYMPYLNKYILAKTKEGTFDKEMFDDLCWMMTSKKNFKLSTDTGVCSQKKNSFKLFCLFNLLSEDRYPLVIIQPELEYLLKKISTAMNQEWDSKPLESLLSQNSLLQEGMSVWEFLEYMNIEKLMKIPCKEAFTLALNDVFMEMYHSVLKKGYMVKKGHVRRNWQERWFVLKPSSMAYYVSEDLQEKKGEIALDQSCSVESIPDKEGKRCLFSVKTPNRTYEMSATDQKQRVDWIQAVQTALRLTQENKRSLHQDLKLQRREQREKDLLIQKDLFIERNQADEPIVQDNKDEVKQKMQKEDIKQKVDTKQKTSKEDISKKENMEKAERKDIQEKIDSIIKQKELEEQRRQKEEQEKKEQKQIQRGLEERLEELKMEKETMQTQIAEMEQEAKELKEKIQELEITQHELENILSTQTQARREEERARSDLERQLQEEQEKYQQLLNDWRNSERSSEEEQGHESRKEEDTLLKHSSTEEHTSSGSITSTPSRSPPPQSGSPPQKDGQLELSAESSVKPPPEPLDVPALPEKHKKHIQKEKPSNQDALRNAKQWNVRLNCLMKPITPGDRLEHWIPIKAICPKQGQALTSTEFITKLQPSSRKEGEEFHEESDTVNQSEAEILEAPANIQEQ